MRDVWRNEHALIHRGFWHDKLHLRADEIDGAGERRRCHRLYQEVIDSGMSSHMVHGSSRRDSVFARVSRHLANAREGKFLIYLVCRRAKQELHLRSAR